MQIKKLDRRMNGYGDFNYGIDLWSDNSTKFNEIRTWCWETFGPSCELDIWNDLDRPTDTRNEKWAWDRGQYNKSFRCVVYLQSDKELNWFKLRFGVA